MSTDSNDANVVSSLASPPFAESGRAQPLAAFSTHKYRSPPLPFQVSSTSFLARIAILASQPDCLYIANIRTFSLVDVVVHRCDDMDHLVRPKDRIPIDDVPVFESALHLYDRLGFKSFPSRTEHSSQDPASQRTHASFVQGWLYFGLLREIFRDSLQVEDFVRPIPPDRPQTVPY